MRHRIIGLMALIVVALGCGAAARADTPLIRESFTRVFVAPEAFKPTIEAYRATTGGRCSMYFPFPARKLDLAAVSSPTVSFLIIAGAPEALERFRATQVTFHVTDLDKAVAAAQRGGATVIQTRTEVPTGVQARVQFAQGLTIEYVEHNEAARRFYTCKTLGLD